MWPSEQFSGTRVLGLSVPDYTDNTDKRNAETPDWCGLEGVSFPTGDTDIWRSGSRSGRARRFVLPGLCLPRRWRGVSS
jgi:hypothetical protein